MGVWLIALLVFAGTALAVLIAARASERFMARYRDNFLDQAGLNLADMFMFMDPGQLYMANVLALVVVPLLDWSAGFVGTVA